MLETAGQRPYLNPMMTIRSSKQVTRADLGIFDWECLNVGAERAVELFQWQITSNSQRRPRVSQSVTQEILLCEKRRTDNRRVPKNIKTLWERIFGRRYTTCA